MSSTLNYCGLTDVVNKLSAEGVSLRLEDDPPTFLGDVLNDASATIDEYLWQRYSPAQLATSDWVRHRAAEITCQLICERLGETVPPGVAAKFARAEKKLERVQKGIINIPNVAMRRTEVPITSHPRIRLDPFPRTVIERSQSTGKVEGKQNSDTLDDAGFYSI